MRARRLLICSCRPLCPQKHASAERIHNVFHSRAAHFSQINNVDLLFAIFTTMDYFSIVEEILEFTAINLVEGNIQLNVSVRVQQVYYVIRSE